MYEGYLAFGDADDMREILNAERTLAYARRFIPTVDVAECLPCDRIHNALGHAPYVDPKFDTAPWYHLNDPDTANFYGLYPLSIQGIDDSTSKTMVTEFTGDGGFQAQVRHGTKEVRVRGVLLGLNRDGVQAGVRWLRSVLDWVPCGRGEICPGRELLFFRNCPGAATSAAAKGLVEKYRRRMYQVEVLDGLRVIGEHKFNQGGWAAEVEFTLSVGVPWAYTDFVPAVTSTGLTGTAVTQVTCPGLTDAYSDLVLDPKGPNLSRPPAPPNVYTAVMPSTWIRYTAVIPQSTVARWGRLTPRVQVQAKANALRMVRVRFYTDTNARPGLDVAECSWEGEFLVTYVPSWSTLTIDGVRRNAELLIGGTYWRTATHLVLGSSGRPPTWPRMACDSAYLVVIDANSPLTSQDKVTIEVAVGE